MSPPRRAPAGSRHKIPEPRPGTDGFRTGLTFSPTTSSGFEPPQPENVRASEAATTHFARTTNLAMASPSREETRALRAHAPSVTARRQMRMDRVEPRLSSEEPPTA